MSRASIIIGPRNAISGFANANGGTSGEGVRDASSGDIREAIYDESEMRFLSFLSSADIRAIANYLAGDITPPPVGSDGASLYDLNCSGCHGPGASSAKAGASVTRINNAISGNLGGISFLDTTLSAADIQAIADFLAAQAPPSTPEGLYVAYCASCHGVDARGGSSGEDVRGDSAGEIRKAIYDESEMRFLNFLSYEQIRSIADYLDNLSR